MFGFFKKKNEDFSIDPRNGDVIRAAAQMIEMQLHLCRSTSNFEKHFDSDFVHGYLFGFFDASIQYTGIPQNNFESLIVLGHSYLFSGDTKKARAYVLESASRQNNEEFLTSQKNAGEECFSFLNGKSKHPIGLMTYFHER